MNCITTSVFLYSSLVPCVSIQFSCPMFNINMKWEKPTNKTQTINDCDLSMIANVHNLLCLTHSLAKVIYSSHFKVIFVDVFDCNTTESLFSEVLLVIENTASLKKFSKEWVLVLFNIRWNYPPLCCGCEEVISYLTWFWSKCRILSGRLRDNVCCLRRWWFGGGRSFSNVVRFFLMMSIVRGAQWSWGFESRLGGGWAGW